MPEANRSLRYRVQVSQTSTGKKSWEATVDYEGGTLIEVLTESDKLVAELTQRYPPEIPEPKKKE